VRINKNNYLTLRIVSMSGIESQSPALYLRYLTSGYVFDIS